MMNLFLVAILVAVVSSQRIKPIGPGFWNVRGSFIIDGIDIGCQMSIVKLSNGKFLIMDTIELDASLKAEFDAFTNNGSQISAVIATHPFHTVYFPAFYLAYPNAMYYGTPRHLRIEPQIKWSGNIYDCQTRTQWPEVEMRIPLGSEFVAPQPEDSNHFSGVHIYHAASKTVHVDDTVNYEVNTGIMAFHPSLFTVGLYHIGDAPFTFRNWTQKYVRDWDFDNICSAHDGNKLGGAKDELKFVLFLMESTFKDLTVQYALNPNPDDKAKFMAMQQHEAACGNTPN